MKNLKVSNETTKKTQGTKKEIKKELDESLINCENHNNTEIKEKAKSFEKSEDAATVVCEFEQIFSNKKQKHYLAGIRTSYNILEV